MPEPLIRLRDVSACYDPARPVITGISLDARAGEVTTLIGSNGCGKSTLLKVMSSLLRPTQGEVLIDDTPLHTLKPRDAAKLVGLLPQHPVAPAGLEVGELIARGRHPYRGRFGGESAADRRAIAEAIDATDVGSLLECDVASLSGGQRQRVWLAMTLAQDTPVLLLDEPTTFLDPAHAIDMLCLVREQARAGKAVVMVLHDLMLAGQYSDQMVVMGEGRMVARGTPREALTSQVLADAFGLVAETWLDSASNTPVIVPRGTLNLQARKQGQKA